MDHSTLKGIDYESSDELSENELKELYDDAGWSNYTNDMARLADAVRNSLLTVTARDNKELIGLIRCVGDGKTIVYIQDILVKSRYKRKGIGTELVETVLKKYNDVRQIVLLTDEDEVTKNFYESTGFETSGSRGLVCFVRIKS